MIKDEEGFMAGYLYVDVAGRDMGRYVDDAKRIVAQNVQLPAGYQLSWSGQYEYLQRVIERLWTVVPITLFIVFLLLYFNTGSLVRPSSFCLLCHFPQLARFGFCTCSTTT